MSGLDLSRSLSPSKRYSLEPSQSPVSPPLSYLSARRPSLTPQPDTYTGSFKSMENTIPQQVPYSGLRNETSFETDEDDEDANFRQSLQIDMKTLVGDAVGNMSISPTSRDVVLAARKGLFIIDLHSPLEVPRFLPQGGTWDVADVQWNPHPSHAEYIVSTSSERLLIWNLLLVGKTSIEFILQSHYRAITDINWHCFEPDLVCSTGIDSWIWAYDLRDPQKPAFGLCAFNAGGTQVKWNRKDANILATSHLDEVLIWDRRRGSVPLSRVKAHDAKIYGIDWSHSRPNEIVSCSLDKKIKVWDINDLSMPTLTFETEHPVWRARDLPFGQGVLSLPQRGGTSLEMWNYGNNQEPIERYDGHADVVKEFVWRSRSTRSDDEYQLITWSKDKTLRFWPVSRDTMLKFGVSSELLGRRKPKALHWEDTISFRSPPLGSERPPALSAPRGHRSILNSVRAPLSEVSNSSHPVLLPHHGSSARASRLENLAASSKDRKSDARSVSKARSNVLHIPPSAFPERRDGTMSKGNAKGSKNTATMEPYTWLSSIRAESVIGPTHARISSGSRPPSGPERDIEGSDSRTRRRRSLSRTREPDAPRESETSTSLLDEINSVVSKLTPAKVKLERHDLAKHRSCTFGLHGPWGESSSINVFVRVTFTFPREYPNAMHPLGTPTIDIERSPLIPLKRRAHMRQELRKIREMQRPCLEACLRFLLYSDGNSGGRGRGIDSGSSSDEEKPAKERHTRDFSASLIRDHQNLAEPRSSQGVFGPNGQLVCVFRSLPRIVRSFNQESISVSASIPTRGRDVVPRLFQSPLLLSDAVRRLALAASDKTYGFIEPKDSEDTENILRIMNNLLSFTQPRHHITNDRHQHGRGSLENAQNNNYSLLPKRTTVVSIQDKSAVVGAHRALAEKYVVLGESAVDLCKRNAEIAHGHARLDHERLFRTLSAILRNGEKGADIDAPGFRPIIRNILESLHEGLLALKDVQLLAMFAIIVLQTQPLTVIPMPSPQLMRSRATPLYSPSKSPEADYFTHRGRHGLLRSSPSLSPRAPHLPSTPTTPTVPIPAGRSSAALTSSLSSRGSWTNLFNATSVRSLMGASSSQDPAVGDSTAVKSGLQASRSASVSTNIPTAHDAEDFRRQGTMPTDISINSQVSGRLNIFSGLSSSQSTGVNSHRLQSKIAWPSSSASPSPASHTRRRRPSTFSQIVLNAPTNSSIPETTVRISDDLYQSFRQRKSDGNVFQRAFVDKLIAHVLAYAEMLDAWGLIQQHAELLKALRIRIPSMPYDANVPGGQTLEITQRCQFCFREIPTGGQCVTCCRVSAALCTVCRMPVKGLSHTCVMCFHVTHLRCWDVQLLQSCPTGCGCDCKSGFDPVGV